MKHHETSYEEKEFATLVNEISKQAKSNQTASQNVEEYVELAELNLPSRSEVHQNAPFRLRVSFAHPLARFICIIILMICLLGVTYYFIGNELLQLFL